MGLRIRSTPPAARQLPSEFSEDTSLGYVVFINSNNQTTYGLPQGALKKSVKLSVSTSSHGNRDVGLARRAAVAVLGSGPWSPEKNRELVMLQVRVGVG